MDQKRANRALGFLAAVAVALVAIWLGTDGLGTGSGDDDKALSTTATSGQPAEQTATSAAPEPSATTAATTATTTAATNSGVDPDSGLPWVALDQLPPEVEDTLGEIDQGPPYPYDRDGVTFENREGLLPPYEYGYYQEFTVPTPGSNDRGARRVIWGLADEFYYTDDHYGSFVRIMR